MRSRSSVSRCRVAKKAVVSGLDDAQVATADFGDDSLDAQIVDCCCDAVEIHIIDDQNRFLVGKLSAIDDVEQRLNLLVAAIDVNEFEGASLMVLRHRSSRVALDERDRPVLAQIRGARFGVSVFAEVKCKNLNVRIRL